MSQSAQQATPAQRPLGQPGERPKSAHAYKQLVRLINRLHDNGVDRMPPQAELRSTLGASNDTISEAMRWLAADGVLKRGPGAGTIIIDPSRARHGFRISILPVQPEPQPQTPFFTNMFYLLTHHLNLSGTTVAAVPPVSQQIIAGLMTGRLDLPDLVNVESTDAIVSLSGFAPKRCREWHKAGCLVNHAGAYELAPYGVLIDYSAVVREGMRMFHELGAKRMGLVSGEPGGGFHQRAHDALWETGKELGMSESKLSCLFYAHVSDDPANTGVNHPLHLGAEVGKRLLSMKPAKRPDALLVTDDYAALGLTNVLSESDYRPLIASHSNREVPFAVPLPMYRFEFNLNDVAKQCIDLTVRLLQRPDSDPAAIWLAPTLLSDTPSCLP